MSRRSISLLVGLYFLAALALSVFRVASNPFFSGWSAVTLVKSSVARCSYLSRRAFRHS